jgi:serine phosphatase RsbU (regulator of sigma subunit)/anti-sigma regulatory factor (Ser/Thr protein kinase)
MGQLRSATRAEVAQALREHLQRATGAEIAFVAALNDDQGSVDIFTPTGSSVMRAPQLGRMVQRTIRDTIVQGRPVELATVDEMRAVFPNLVASGLQRLTLYPIRARRSVVAVIGLGWTTPLPAPAPANAAADDDAESNPERLLAIAAGLGGAAFERATTYDNEHLIAETLQRQLLTEPNVAVPQLEWAARYAPGSEKLTAGGDWYDVIEVQQDRIGLVVGDIVGHGVEAAAAMGQLRSATRALAVRDSPTELLHALDHFTNTTGQGDLSSVAYLVLDLDRRWAEYALAGHPPPLVRRADGRAVFVEEGRGPLLGLAPRNGRTSGGFALEAGDVVVLYTDGLVERRGESIDTGLEQLRDLVAAMPTELHPDGICDRLLDAFDRHGPKVDDITLLVISFTPTSAAFQRLSPARLASLRAIRSEVRRWSEANAIRGREAEDLLIAVAEATANAVQHGSGADPAALVGLRMQADAEQVVARVTDSGRWADPGRAAERGHGLHIMQAVMDGVDVRAGEGGSEVAMWRRRQPGD